MTCQYLQWRHAGRSTSTPVMTYMSAACPRTRTTHFRATWDHVTAIEAVWRHCVCTDRSQSTCSNILSASQSNIDVISHLVVLTTKVGHVLSDIELCCFSSEYLPRLNHWRETDFRKVYQQNEFHRDNPIHGWDITTSGLEKKCPTYWNYSFGFDFDYITVIKYVDLYSA